MSLTHDALMFASDDELVAGTHDLIAEGVAAGDLVLVHGPDPGLAVLRDAWDDDPRITFGDRSALYDVPMHTIGSLQRILEHEGARGHRLRVTGQVPFGDDPRTRRGWMRYEALVDRALAPYDFTSLCLYDTRTTTTDLLDHARDTHARVFSGSGVEPGGQRRSEVLAELARPDEADPLEAAPVVHDGLLMTADDLAAARAGLAEAPPGLVAAANEVLTNALQHGRAPVTVRLHHGPDGWLCVVTDRGRGLLDPYAGVDAPGRVGHGGTKQGLWVARQLCDELTIAPGPDGLGTRVHLRHRG